MKKSLKKLPVFLSLLVGALLLIAPLFLIDKTQPYQAPTSTPVLIEKILHKPLTVSLLASAEAFTPKLIRAKVGQEVNVRILSRGTHSFTIDELKVDTITPDNQTTVITFTPTEEGTFRFYSHIGNDLTRMMAGQLIVSK